jgi:hypothetical protein
MIFVEQKYRGIFYPFWIPLPHACCGLTTIEIAKSPQESKIQGCIGFSLMSSFGLLHGVVFYASYEACLVLADGC